MDFEKHCRGNFGSYIEAHYHDTITNTMKARAYPALLLGPTGNIQGTIKAYDLTTGRVKKPRTFTPYPIPDRVIKAVNKIGLRDQTKTQERRLELRNRRNERFDWDNDELIEDEREMESRRSIAHPEIPANPPGITFENEIVPDGAVDRVITSENEI